MQVLHCIKKGLCVNTIEKFHVYKETTDDNQLNDKRTLTPNEIFKTVTSSESHNMQV